MKTTMIGALLLVSAAFAEVKKRPNVLFIAIDDLRPELGCYGAPQVKSPNLNKLASEGLLFERAYCQVAVCGASRASMMTSVLPTSKRFRIFRSRADKDAPGAKTLPQVFKEAGYTTLSNGKIFHTQGDSEDRSWSEPDWRPELNHAFSHDPATTNKLSSTRGRGRIYEHPDVADNAYGDGQVAEKTIADLKRLKEEGTPFFLGCGFVRPHLPFYAPKKYWDLYDRESIEIASNRERPENAPGSLGGSGEYKAYHLADFEKGSDEFHRVMRHGYMASVSYVDKLVGDVLAELESLGLADNTIIVVWGDHGWHLGEHNFWGKHNTMHLSVRVPLFIKVPNKLAGKTEALVETIDVFPTLCSLAGISVPETVQGKDFSTLLENPNQPFREVAYSRYKGGDVVVTDRYAYTRYSKGAEMLYDHLKDPDENRNVAGNPEYKEIVQKMRTLLEARMKEASEAKVKER